MRHIRAILIAMTGILSILVPAVRADSLQLKNGNFVQGKYLGGTDRAVQFEVNGKIRLYGVDEILSISFAAASADGGMPSDDVDPKSSAGTPSNSAATDNRGLRTVLWNQKKVPGQETHSQQGQYSCRAKTGLALGPARSSRAAVAANSDVMPWVSEIPTRSVRILPRRVPVLSD